MTRVKELMMMARELVHSHCIQWREEIEALVLSSMAVESVWLKQIEFCSWADDSIEDVDRPVLSLFLRVYLCARMQLS